MRETRRMRLALAVAMLASVACARGMVNQQSDAPMDMADMQII